MKTKRVEEAKPASADRLVYDPKVKAMRRGAVIFLSPDAPFRDPNDWEDED